METSNLTSEQNLNSDKNTNLTPNLNLNNVPEIKATNDSEINLLQWSNLKITATKTQKAILDNLSGEVQAGRSLAIMGSSGAGKTTFLNYLSKKMGNSSVGLKKESGNINLIVNGVDETKSFLTLSGYVTQDDILFEVLTPRELLTFAANIKLSHKKETERKDLVEDLITRLGLEKCADTRVGSALEKGLSGGEKKRTAIGYELITDPMILFLDEPTTGLDSVSAHKIIKLATDEARINKRIVIFTIHQPNSEIGGLFDKLLLMSEGKITYHGEYKDTIGFFAGLGYSCPAKFNPSEFFIKVLSKESKSVDNMNLEGDWVKFKKRRSTLKRKISGVVDGENGGNLLNDPSLNLEAIRDSQANNVENIDTEEKKVDNTNKYSHEEVINLFANKSRETLSITDIKSLPINHNYLEVSQSSFCQELKYLFGRSIKVLARKPESLKLKVASTFLNAILIILIFGNLGTGDSAILDRNGCLFFIGNAVIQTALQFNLLVMTTEKPKFYKDQESSMYGVTSYFISKTVLDIPIMLFNAISLFGITYFATGLSTLYASNYFNFILTLFLVAYTGNTFAIFLSSIIDRIELIPAIFPFLLYTQVQSSGFTVALANIPYIFYPFKYISVFRYSYQALTWTEYKGQTPESLDCNIPRKCKLPTDDFPEDFTWSILALVILATSMNVLAVVSLKVKVWLRKREK